MDIKGVKPPKPILIKLFDGTWAPAEINFNNENFRYYVATVPGEQDIAMRRVWLPYDGEGRTWIYQK